MTETDEEKLARICKWIDENLDEPIGWVQLSRYCELSHTEIQRLFHTQLKTSPMQWIRQQREAQQEAERKSAEVNQYNVDWTYKLFDPRKPTK